MVARVLFRLLIQEGLVDEYHLFVNPTAIGKGMSIFSDLKEPRKFTMKKATSFAVA